MSRLTALVLVLFGGTLSCSYSGLESDRFTDAVIEATADNKSEAVFRLSSDASYSIAVFKGPKVDDSALRKAGLAGARLEGVIEAAPKDFTVAVAVVTPTTVSVGWFLGNYVILHEDIVAQKNPNETITIVLKYGGRLPEIVQMR